MRQRNEQEHENLPRLLKGAQVPRYFLHVRDGVDIALDPKGRDFPNIHVAEAEARKVVRELLANWPSGWPDVTADLIVAIEDRAGQTLMSIPFSKNADQDSGSLDVPLDSLVH